MPGIFKTNYIVLHFVNCLWIVVSFLNRIINIFLFYDNIINCFNLYTVQMALWFTMCLHSHIHTHTHTHSYLSNNHAKRGLCQIKLFP